MSLETEVAALTTATTDLLTAVNVSKATLDDKVATAAEQANTATTQAEIAIAASARNLGARTNAPTLRADGSALQSGDYYFNTVSNATFVFSEGVWGMVTGATAADLASATDPAKGAALVGMANSSVRQMMQGVLGATRAGSWPMEDFDRPEGTLCQNLQTISGHTLIASGPGNEVVQINGNGMHSVSNVYTGLAHSAIIKRVSGVFSFDVGAGSNRPVIMFNGGPTSTTLNNLIHLEINVAEGGGSIEMKFAVGATANLSPPAGTRREINGKTSNHVFLRGLRVDEKYHISMEYVVGATDMDDAILVNMPDGRVLQFQGDARIRQVMSTCQYGTWQLTGPGVRWHHIGIGEERASAIAAVAGCGNLIDSLPILGLSVDYRPRRGVSFSPAAVGWYAVAQGISFPNGGYSALSGRVRIQSSDNNGRRTNAEFHVECSHVGSPVITPISNGFGTFGGNVITLARLSRDASSNGMKQLELYVNTRINANDQTTIEFDGAMAPIDQPVAGSTSLAGSVRSRSPMAVVGAKQEGATATKTFVPGVDLPNQILINHYVGTVTFNLDDGNAQPGDEFTFARGAFSQSAILQNLSDGSVIATVAPSTTVRVGIVSGKFALLSRGTY